TCNENFSSSAYSYSSDAEDMRSATGPVVTRFRRHQVGLSSARTVVLVSARTRKMRPGCMPWKAIQRPHPPKSRVRLCARFWYGRPMRRLRGPRTVLPLCLAVAFFACPPKRIQADEALHQEEPTQPKFEAKENCQADEALQAAHHQADQGKKKQA